MDYSIDEMETDLMRHVERLRAMRKAKGADYSGDADTFKNFREWGSKGVLVRIGDKVNRMNSLFRRDAMVLDEKLEDTVDDLINYALYLRILLDQEKPVD